MYQSSSGMSGSHKRASVELPIRSENVNASAARAKKQQARLLDDAAHKSLTKQGSKHAMPHRRPFMEKSTAEIRTIFESAANDLKLLRKIESELRYRHTRSAYQLAEDVDKAIAQLTPTPAVAGVAVSTKPISDIVQLACERCSQQLRVDLTRTAGYFRCPTCNARFAVRCEHRVVSLLYTNTLGSESH